ncbi:hypothetical protein ACFWF9_00020 [Streptomyces roseolus]|uniref:hypothetical protein n=1 Tax=Streptomyces roseolus TaxID=67358 RepID=UPI003662C1BB
MARIPRTLAAVLMTGTLTAGYFAGERRDLPDHPLAPDRRRPSPLEALLPQR